MAQNFFFFFSLYLVKVDNYIFCPLAFFLVYKQLFDKLSDDGTSTTKSTVLTAQAMVAFAQGNNDSCKTLLFKA